MARKSIVTNPTVLNANMSRELNSTQAVAVWAKATGMSEAAAREDLLVTGFNRRLALFVFKPKKAKKASKKASKK